ncbi:MAG: MFS transporter [Bacteroidetes bacterium 4572_117]|nr:MAG: MFS transporter [Bacteroidetes bacterium 4572_117]
MSSKMRSVWTWIPSLYLTMGIPYIVVMSVAVAMYANLGLPNGEIALYTSYLNLPWVIKPLWSPVVVALKTKRWWIYVTQLFMGAAFAMTAYFIQSDSFIALTLAGLALVAFNSATHDIAADGIYMDALSEEDQSFYVGIRSSFYRVAMITGQGGLVWLSGYFYARNGGDYFDAWTTVFIGVAIYLVVAGLYHIWSLPKIEEAESNVSLRSIFSDFGETFVTFFKLENIGIHITVLMLYRLGEAQLVKLAQPFLFDDMANGGMALSNEQVGIFYGTIGVSMLTIGGILGGVIVSRDGLKKWFFPMILAINIPNSMYLLLAYFRPESNFLIGGAIALEQFGYGFGFTAYMMYMIYIARDSGKYKTAHFAFATGFMALGMTLPGMVSGWLQEIWGYTNFFLWVLACMIPMIVFYKFVKIDPNFGKKDEKA